MLLNHVAEGCFSAIAASFNQSVESLGRHAAYLKRVCRAWHVTTQVQVLGPGFRRAEG
uniref:Uncharacterized protein n=1 Tax=mine drainage metagenome TaxID=410659 RepID=E6QW31_9ZZZZ